MSWVVYHGLERRTDPPYLAQWSADLMRIFLCMVLFFAASVFATTQSVLKFAMIESVDDSAFGAKRLYFDLACNQEFLQVLENKLDANLVDVGVLTRLRDEPCDAPTRQVYARYNPYGKSVNPVQRFKEVWYCEATCFTPGGPDMPPYNRFVSSFGTSEKQATDYLGCTPPYLQHLSCRLEIVQPVAL